MGEERPGIIDRLTLEDKLAAGLIIFAGIFLLIQVSSFQHIPSPLYGGDFYMARGFTQAILNGRPFWQDPYHQGGYAYYGWLSYLMTAGLVKLTGISLERMTTLLPAFLHLVYLFAAYLFGSALFKSKKYGLAFMLTSFAFKIIDMKLSAELSLIMMLFALYFFVRYEQVGRGEPGARKRGVYGLFMGLFMGLTALSHINMFFGLIVIVCGAIALEYLGRIRKLSFPKTTIYFIKRYSLPLLLAFAIAMLLVGPWVFFYHMEMPNPSQQYSTQDISTMGVGWLLMQPISLFLRKGLVQIIISVVLLLGLLFCILNRKQNESKLVLFWLLSAFVGAGHFLITKPLLNTWSVPGYIWGAAIWVVELSLFVYGLKNIELMLVRMSKNEQVRKVAYGIFLAFLALLFITNLNAFNNDRWTQYGRTMDQGTQVLFEVGEWVISNTGRDDVFLASDEGSFAMNALTGRWVVMARRTHSSFYMDVDKRYADGIVMLYGNNKTKVEELLREYNVSYLFLDVFLYSENQHDMITNLKYEQYLSENGINYTIQDIRLDPASPVAPTYISLVVPPQELKIRTYNLTTPALLTGFERDVYSIYKILV